MAIDWFRGLKRPTGPARGLLARLAHDRRANTIALMAAALLPMTALAGSAIDISRMYLVRARLQQACDAGVLAGRKAMTGSTLDTNAAKQANDFFKNNFVSGWMGTSAVSFTPSLTGDFQVSGVASAVVPMTLTKIFSASSNTMSVACQARYDIADLDIMFVLDTTGSMACAAADTKSVCSTYAGANGGLTYTRSDGSTGYYVREKSNARIAALRTAVLNFYDTLQTSANSTTHIRYGFVPYSSTVNVGKLLYAMSPNYLVTGDYTYQSRRLAGNDYNIGSATETTYTGRTSAQCDALVGRSPSSGYNSSTGRATVSSKVSWTRTGNSSSTVGNCVISAQTVGPVWRYQPVSYNLSAYVTGATINDPSTVDTATTSWSGCIEERGTTASSSFSQSSLPSDLNPDLVPSSNATRWRPQWPDVTYYRGTSATATFTSDGDSTTYPGYGSATRAAQGFAACPKQASRLGEMTRSQVSAYVNANDFRAIGGTYHDIGMIWGTRMLSPNGIFAADTATWSGSADPPARYIIFMTDGEMEPNLAVYGAYGIEYYDQRITGTAANTNQTDYHNTRFTTACAAAKARNITVFVVAFGQTLTSELTECATSGQAYYASNDDALNTAFATIASQIARLRLSK